MEGVGHMGAPLEVMWETLALGTRFLPVLVVIMGLSVLLQSLGIADAAHHLLGGRSRRRRRRGRSRPLTRCSRTCTAAAA